MITTQPPQFFGHPFITHKILVSFMEFLSKRIYVERYSPENNVLKYIEVPIDYYNKDKFMRNLNTSTKINTHNMQQNPVQLNRILPRMAVNLISIIPFEDIQRNKFDTIRGRSIQTDKIVEIQTPVSYTLNVELGIISKTSLDFLQIYEQLVPYFRPSLTKNINLLEGFPPEQITYEIGDGVITSKDEWEYGEERIFTASINFSITAKYYFIPKNESIIRQIIAHYKDSTILPYANFVDQTVTQIGNLTPVSEIVLTTETIVDHP